MSTTDRLIFELCSSGVGVAIFSDTSTSLLDWFSTMLPVSSELQKLMNNSSNVITVNFFTYVYSLVFLKDQDPIMASKTKWIWHRGLNLFLDRGICGIF